KADAPLTGSADARTPDARFPDARTADARTPDAREPDAGRAGAADAPHAVMPDAPHAATPDAPPVGTPAAPPPAPPDAGASPVEDGTILFVTQVPVADFGSSTSVFGNHLATLGSAPRGGDLMLRYSDGTLRNLTREAGYGESGMQGDNAIAVRDP